MARQTVESIRERAAALRAKIAEGGAAMDPAARRSARKRVRRLQRKRRKMEAEQKRRAGVAPAKKEG